MLPFRIGFIFLLFPLFLFSQTEKYSKVKINLNEETTILKMASLGLIDKGDYKKNKHYISDFSVSEIRVMHDNDLDYEILIDDVGQYYKDRLHSIQLRTGHCENQTETYPVPDNYNTGSMGGYLTYSELLSELDDMRNLFPNLITAKTPISTTLTHENREIYWLRISDNPDVDENEEPEVLYVSLIHAREPGSMQQMVFFMWYILENYSTDPEIKNLLDNTELYFIPCLNPDGYIYNELTNPNGAGFWRKNRRDNGDGTFGVDINRNFGYKWGNDDNGSSPNSGSEIYRGPAPFSEPESQNLKTFIEQREFKIALNYHSYGGLLIRPWGYTSQLPDDIQILDAIANVLTRENNYSYGDAFETVGYGVNGVIDDFNYGDHGIYTYTPEVGTSFWESMVEIEATNNQCLHMNLSLPRLALKYGELKENSPYEITELSNELDFNFQRIGLMDGPITITLLNENNIFESVGSPINLDLNFLENSDFSIPYVMNSNIQGNTPVLINLEIDYGFFKEIVTVQKEYQTVEDFFVINDNGISLDNWQSGTNWGVTILDYFSPPTSITDSPSGEDYGNNIENYLVLDQEFDFTNATRARVMFKGKWDIEKDYDFVQFQGEIGAGGYDPICGIYTRLGSEYQDEGNPVWDGTQSEWVTEIMDLSDYLGSANISFRFGLISDQFVTGDGFYFDDFKLEIVTDEGVGVYEFTSDDFIIQSFPNPSKNNWNVEFSEPIENGQLMIADALGKKILEKNISGKRISCPTSSLMRGIYFVRIFEKGKLIAIRKLVKE